MKNYSRDFWNGRYAQEDFVYGKKPNGYLRAKLEDLVVGKAVFPADGEGRNSVYAAALGWQVVAFDQSEEGIAKAILLADQNNVKINYMVADMDNITLPKAPVDMVALIYAHFPEADRRRYHKKLASLLRNGGYLILEGFGKGHAKNQLDNPKAGGPKDVEMLYDLNEIKVDFEGFVFLEAYETQTVLSEGDSHKGNADVVRVFAIKK